ncbi:MAG: hypothetical protein IT405_02020 [Candidatus Yanofskybacteria bacterium]|nr:hypothetical protein [Candidatus Yanofskybacteria bacterium]
MDLVLNCELCGDSMVVTELLRCPNCGLSVALCEDCISEHDCVAAQEELEARECE